MVTDLLDVDRVTALLQQVIAEEIMPRFRRLAPSEIVAKPSPGDPRDIVTVVDHAVERTLAGILPSFLPGSVVVGEEAAADDPSILGALKTSSPVWVVDPLDGTKNFARGDEAFGVIVALVRGGRTRAGWIGLPARRRMFVAEEGAGAYRDGERLVVRERSSERAHEAAPRGGVKTAFLPARERRIVDNWSDGRFRPVRLGGCAASEYTAIVEGHNDFVVYHRLLPWDHAAPSLLLTEAGGVVLHADGERYGPLSTDQPTVVAGSIDLAERVRGWFAT